MKNTKPITKEDILNDINILKKQYNFINSEIYKMHGNYSLYLINKLFNSFNNMLKEYNKNYVEITNIPQKSINKQELFDLANNLFKLNNYLTEEEFYKHMNISINKFDSEFGSFTEFLKEANLYDKIKNEFSNKQSQIRLDWCKNNSNKIFNFSKEDAINKGKEIFNKIGEIKKDIYLEYTNYDKKTFLKMFNTFTEFLKEAKLYEQMRIINNSKKGSKNNNFYNGNNKIKEFTKEDCFIKAKEILINENDLNKEIFLEKTNYDKKAFLKMFNNSFRNFIQESGLYEEIKNIRKQYDSKTIKITKEKLINQIQEYIKSNNIIKLKSNELYKNTNITQNIIKTYWESFTEMKKELKLNIPKEVFPPKDEIIEHMWTLYNKYGKLTSTIQRKDGKYEKRIIDNVFGSFTDMLKEMKLDINIPKNISIEELLLDLQSIVKKHGMINSILIDKEGKYSRPTYLNYLGGSITQICKYLNIYYINQRSSISSSGLYVIYLISNILNSQYELEKQFDWLINLETNYNLRLDGYFSNYNLAIEYDGIQHFQNVDFFYNNYEYVKSNDKIKNQLCEENGIKLIRIKYNEPLNEEYLKEKLIKEGIIKE